MTQPDQLAKHAFSLDASDVTEDEVGFEDPPEIGLTRVQADGYLVVRRRERIRTLPYPWPLLVPHDQVLLEIKMAGDHLDEEAIERALLRRQARQVQRVVQGAAEGAPPPEQTPLWLLAPHIPRALTRTRVLTRLAAGCYLVEPSGFPFLWIAANELPLRIEIVPFLLARSGSALDEFARWVAPQKPLAWVADMVECLSMSNAAREEIFLQHLARRKDDPEMEARRLWILQGLLDHTPEVRQELIEQGIEKGIEQGIEEGIEKGIEKGQLDSLRHLFERRLARPLMNAERDRLAHRLRVEGADRLTDLALDLSPEALATWLATQNER